MFVCIIQHRNRPLRSTALNAHATNASPDGLVHAHLLTKPSRAGFAVSRSELIEPGAATCAFRGMAGPSFKFQKLGTYVSGTNTVYHNGFLFYFSCFGKDFADRGFSQL